MTAAVSSPVTDRQPLLGAGDPPPYELVNPTGSAPLLLVCDHASHTIPAALGDLGLDDSVRLRHIGWDIGAAEVTRRLAALLDAPAVLAGYSRLVVDCNRPPGTPSSIPTISDGVTIPGNAGLDEAAVQARIQTCFEPYHQAIEDLLAGMIAVRPPAFVSMHSFTPRFDDFDRPWHVGVLWDQDDRFAKPLMAALAGLPVDPPIHVGDNEPYSGRIPPPYSTPRHGQDRGLLHVTVEIRQDLIDSDAGVELWARHMMAALRTAL